MTVSKSDPIVLIGGFGSDWRVYRSFGHSLARVSSRRVFIVGITHVTWMVAGYLDYRLLVKRTNDAVHYALRKTGASRVILVGHSAGGVIARAFLADKLGGDNSDAYCGHTFVSRVYMLGSPLAGVEKPRNPGLRHAAWLDNEYPGAYYAPEVEYLAVAGKCTNGHRSGTFIERRAYQAYDFISGNGDQWGDGVVPVALSTPVGMAAMQIDGVAHSPLSGARWYGADEATIRMWWDYFDIGDSPLPAMDHIVA